MTHDSTLTANEGGTTLITLNRPQRLNAFTPGGYQDLASALRSAADDPKVRVAVITGAGRAFSTGVDLAALQGPEPDQRDALRDGYRNVLDALIRFPKPLLAAVNGRAIGFGVTMLLHCDLVLAANDATFCMPFTQLGLCPEGASSYLLPRAIGTQQAAFLLLTGSEITATTAAELGVIWRHYEPDHLLDEARRVAKDLAAKPAASLQATKRLLKAAHRDDVSSVVEHELQIMESLARNAAP